MTADTPLYDDPAFFTAYQRMRAAGSGLNEELEQPALRRLLPAVADLDVLDLGCGDGTQARWLATAAARSVLGVDPSARMLELARRHKNPLVRYVCATAEELSLPDASLDLASVAWPCTTSPTCPPS
ncbi:class I SAM-dependent methyltransferase [Streptomyces silvisoli]|uniref:Class I SAM-dependent methyltransferase n=1 Tax=Streptomyces silvisoli TaxID=3034235 RepID=A0ABT5ZLK4_9ACTN|nr:class I SAM-dependent methyltransferase [Streptomyces silvisoli]MDF3290703.1 class I SAM-dependent methyltransferase [Streptomyces silvisoli]